MFILFVCYKCIGPGDQMMPVLPDDCLFFQNATSSLFFLQGVQLNMTLPDAIGETGFFPPSGHVLLTQCTCA